MWFSTRFANPALIRKLNLTLCAARPVLTDVQRSTLVPIVAGGFSAYSPDVEGCVAAGPSRQDVEQSMREAITLHLEQLRGEGKAVPEPRSYATYVEVAA